MLVENKQGDGFDMLKCSPQLEQHHAELAEIVIHAQIVFSLKPSSLLLQPLALLAANPSAMVVSNLTFLNLMDHCFSFLSSHCQSMYI